MPDFSRAIGVDYSGAGTPLKAISGLRVYMSECGMEPDEVSSPETGKHWNRRELTNWLIDRLREERPTIVGIDHGFSFPKEYFEFFNLQKDWAAFLNDFQFHWPTDGDDASVQQIRDGLVGRGAERIGKIEWKRETEKRSGAKSIFHFGVQGQVAYSTHAGIPWLRIIREECPDSVHFWPFDGWDIQSGRSVVAEVYPALWSRIFAMDGRNKDQHDAYSIAAWFALADDDGSLKDYLRTNLSAEERRVAEYEGWILGVSRALPQWTGE